MTCLANIFLPNGIIMAADSIRQIINNYVNRNISGTVIWQKLFYLEKTKTGITSTGMSGLDDKSIRVILSEFSETINLKMTQYEVGVSLGEFILNNYPQLNNDFYLGGYSNGNQFAFELERIPQDKSKYNLTQCNLTKNITGRFSPKAVEYAQPSFININSMNIDQAIAFVKGLYSYEIQTVQSDKQYPDTGFPIDIIVLQPDSYYFSDIKNSADAIIK